MENKILYLKIEQNNVVTNKKVYLKDVAKMYSPGNPSIVSELDKICILTVEGDEDMSYSFSIMKIIDIIGRRYKDVSIVNLGEKDFVISYKKPGNKKPVLDYIKAVAIAAIVFFGAAFTIMTFNEDVSVGTVFDMVYKLFGAQEYDKYKLMEISYSVGLALGIIIFFNHFSKVKTHVDPTPLQIEMRKYEKEINAAIIASASKEGRTKDV